MATVSDLIQLCNERWPFTKAAGWDAVGLQIGDPGAQMQRVGVCHDVTDRVVDVAVADGVDTLVAYHPLLFRPLHRVVSGPGPSGLAWRLARAGISLVVTHTAFDVGPGGAADALAAELDLRDVRPFGPVWGEDTVKVVTFVPPDAVDVVIEAMTEAGAGVIGAYSHCVYRSSGLGSFVPMEGAAPVIGRVGQATTTPEERVEMVAPRRTVDAVAAALARSHPYEEPPFDIVERRGDAGFVGRIGRFEGTAADVVQVVTDRLGGAVRVAGALSAVDPSVAVVPGSGASLIAAAAGAGADLLVTGDVKHHDARTALSRGVDVVDAGHAATERPGTKRLYAAVAAEVDDAVDLTETDGDVWHPAGRG